MKNKLILTLVVVFILSIVLTACGTTPAATADTSSSSSSSSTTIDAKALVETKCTACHSLDRVAAQKLDAAGWAKVVDKMDKKGGIGFTADEKSAIAAYLAETYK